MTQHQQLAPGTLTSILPEVEDIFEQIYGLLGDGGGDTEIVVAKAKQIQVQLSKMKSAAASLPGGDLGAEAVRELTVILEEQAEKRRAVLEAFCETPTPMADEVARDASP